MTTIIAFFLLAIPLSFSHGNDDMMTGKQLIETGIPCSELDEGQLEAIGEYYMEQMHPGESHEIMDEMMGGEGSESLHNIHVAITRRLYCKENTFVGYGMMGSNSRMPMMNSGMTSVMFGGGNMPYGMMNGYVGTMGTLGTGIYGTLYFLLVLGLVILTYLWIIKIWKEVNEKKK